MKVEVVIPHHLNNLDFLEEWQSQFAKTDVEVHLIIIEDKKHNETSFPKWLIPLRHFNYYNHIDIEAELGKNSWIIPRGTSAIRSYGLYKAWQRKPDFIITLDNDCYPDREETYFVEGHLNNLNNKITLDWMPSSNNDFLSVYSRGFPYAIRHNTPVYISHGLWSNIPDLDGPTTLSRPNMRTKPINSDYLIPLPRWSFYPMCGMNLAFRPEVTPLMYFGLFGPQFGFDQYDDIWAGVFSKKVMDHLRWGVISGYPSVEHRKQSNVFTNLKKQAGGLDLNEELWQKVRDIKLTANNPIDCYRELIDQLKMSKAKDYFKKVKKATKIWLNLFT